VAAFRALAPGGVLLLETPFSFEARRRDRRPALEPTRLVPLPEEAQIALLEAAGFTGIRRRALNADPRFRPGQETGGWGPEIADALLGPQDLAVIGTRPGGRA
ncbi:MAG: hypothetical protein GVY27_11955, partial [Deinococcus-Thermus bacterium]|nr:hypothetical protein [Deinococcota bacterium]